MSSLRAKFYFSPDSPSLFCDVFCFCFVSGWDFKVSILTRFQHFAASSIFFKTFKLNNLRTAKKIPPGSYLYSFKNRDFKQYSYSAMCVPSDVCSVDVAGASKGMKLGTSVKDMGSLRK